VPRGWGRHGAWSRFDCVFKKADTAHSLWSVAWSYPVTPLAVFALGCRFDRWDAIKAINAPNLGQPAQPCPPVPEHAGMDNVGPAGRWSWPQAHAVAPRPAVNLRVAGTAGDARERRRSTQLRLIPADRALLFMEKRATIADPGGCRLRPAPGGTPCEAPSTAPKAASDDQETPPESTPLTPGRTWPGPANRTATPTGPAGAPPSQQQRTGGGWHGPRQHPGPLAA